MKNPYWDASQIKDQKGKVIIVTGSTSGIGKEAVKMIADKNAKLIMAVRNVDKGQKVVSEIQKLYNQADIEVRKLDVSDLNSVRAFANSFQADYDRLDLLINNAGIMYTPYSKTADGFENQLGTNHLGHFALTGLLMPLLKRTNLSRIVVLSSSAHNTQEHIHYQIVNHAKNLLSGTSEPISDIAYKLGFEYPANFSKFFKSRTGMSPNQFRKY